MKCHIRTKTQQYLQDKGITLKSEGMNPGKRETFIVEEVKGTAWSIKRNKGMNKDLTGQLS